MNPQQQNPAFVLAFTSLTVILLSFLIFLNSLATPNVRRENEALMSLEKQFYKKPSGGTDDNATKPATKTLLLPELQERLPNMSFAERISEIISEKAKTGTKLEINDSDFIVRIPTDILFVPTDDQLSAEYQQVLRNLVTELKTAEYRVFIETYTDGVEKVSDRFPSHWHLSVARVGALYRFFLDHELPAKQIKARAFSGNARIAKITISAEVVE